MNEKKTTDWKVIIGGIVLIVVMFAAIKFVFWGLGKVIRQDVPPSQSVSISQDASASRSGQAEAPSFCVHCGKELPESFRWGQFCPYCGEKIEQ